jgi:hypothetical protein
VGESRECSRMDGGQVAKDVLRFLVRSTISVSRADGIAPSELRGIALSNMERDERISRVPSFDDAVATIVHLPDFVKRFGTEAATRIVLQFVNQYFARNHAMSYNETVFEELCCDLLRELQSPVWVFRGVANVRYFLSDVHHVGLGDGITIRGRSQNDLAALGFHERIWNRVADDWSGFGASSFVLVVEHSIPKNPENLILVDSYQLSVKTMRATLALRLCGEGSIGTGPMWVIRSAHFNVGIGGVSRVGASIPTMGAPYRWVATLGAAYSSIYNGLKELDEGGYKASPGNLFVALRAFGGTYDRWRTASDSQLLDCVTAIEALLGAENEISFKLSFRVASLLASTDDERSSLLKLLKDFYDTRSRVIHGAHLRPKHHALLQRIEELRQIVRRLFVAFIHLADSRINTEGVFGRRNWMVPL